MGKRLRLTDEAWSYGSYPREDYKYDSLYLSYQYKDFIASYNLNTRRFHVMDHRIQRMVQEQVISPEIKEEYDRQVVKFMEDVGQYDAAPIEEIYEEIHNIRRCVVGVDTLEEIRRLQMKQQCSLENELGIDQRRKRDQLLADAEVVIFALCQAELFSLMERDIRLVTGQGKQARILVDPDSGYGLPTEQGLKPYFQNMPGVQFVSAAGHSAGLNVSGISWDQELQDQIDAGKACLLVYGEEGLFQCKHLLVDSIVYADACSYYAKAVTNQLDTGLASVVYVPSHFSIEPYVPLVEKTRLSFWQLAKLWDCYGDRIYSCSLKKLYQTYPQYFLNVYANGTECPEAEEEYPIQLDGSVLAEEDKDHWLSAYDRLRDEAIKEYLNLSGKLRYLSTYFDEDMEEVPIPWVCKEKRSGIMVQGVCIDKAKDSRVSLGAKKKELHQMVKKNGQNDKGSELQIMSNFLFFMTPKLAMLYNELRRERPWEQYAFDHDHLDYMLCERNGKRIETFPLYKKACIAMMDDGKFLFFTYRLKAGRITVSGEEISWAKGDVDVDEDDEVCENAPVRVYTPYGSLPDEQEEVSTYRKLVGAGRLNLIILQDKITCVRMGDVVLPSTGVVISLNQSEGERFLKKLGLQELGDGYYSCENQDIVLELEPPSQVRPEDWKRVKWAYGGGMSLIFEGKAICDDDQMEQWLREEGWMSPLSCQTQESQLHKLAKHPRTAIGVTTQGKLVVLVFSGRTKLSSGADYIEMCRIARKLFPDIRYMMNVDGGGSAVLGMAIGRSFMELSYPALSLESTVGMARPISTVLCLR